MITLAITAFIALIVLIIFIAVWWSKCRESRKVQFVRPKPVYDFQELGYQQIRKDREKGDINIKKVHCYHN